MSEAFQGELVGVVELGLGPLGHHFVEFRRGSGRCHIDESAALERSHLNNDSLSCSVLTRNNKVGLPDSKGLDGVQSRESGQKEVRYAVSEMEAHAL